MKELIIFLLGVITGAVGMVAIACSMVSSEQSQIEERIEESKTKEE